MDMTSYGFSYRITDKSGMVRSGSGSGYIDRAKMLADFNNALFSEHFTPVRWWQFWRWNDYPRNWPR